MGTLIQQVLSGNVTVGDLRRGLPNIRVNTPAVVVPWSISMKH
ncbi:hypothetical protein T05_2469 [Trichinella murrelli]|uniref:Uncharacterized protein n=1 Tax=Trichinella murrelli TaxID=144512 RepID=A0A0V0SU08_9BILA|nr:hypothetical protein T05_2469 [Trichinella murrelli]